jgi:hypothetical protein
MDELVPGPYELPFLCEGRGASEDEDWDSGDGDVVDGSSESLGATINMHDDSCRAATRLVVTADSGRLETASSQAPTSAHHPPLSTVQSDTLVGRGDKGDAIFLSRVLPSYPGFEERRVITTKVDKRMGNAGLGQRLCAALLSCGCQEGQTAHSHREGRSWMLLAWWLEMLSVSCWLEMGVLGEPSRACRHPDLLLYKCQPKDNTTPSAMT